LTDLILDASTTTIKTDGKEGDPYAFLAPVSMKDAKSTDYVKYINQCDLDLSTQLAKVSNKKVSLLMSERFINMPIQVVAPLYKIVLDDVEKAEGSHFDFYLIPSRKYEVNDEAEGNSNKRVKTVEVDYYHYEDKYFEDNATYITSLESKKGVIQTFILISHDGLTKAVGQLEDAIAAAF
jgi:protein BCP1